MSNRRVIADPVKKASDAEFRRSQQLLPSLSSGVMSPGASQTAESGAGTVPPTDTGSTRPDYRGYGGGGYGYGGGHGVSGQELAPTSSPVSGTPVLPSSSSTTPPAPAAQTPTISATKRPFFSSPPTPEPTPSTTEPPVAADTPDTAVIVIPPETSPKFTYASAPDVAPEPSPEQGSEFLLWQQQSTENFLPDRQQLNVDEEYLYETYFH